MKETFTTHSAEETRDLGEKLAQEIMPGTLVCLKGDLGAGKTTFAQGFLEGVGAIRPYSSPTFVIMKQYALASPSKTGVRRVYHVDAYRVEAKDFADLGFAEWCADKEGVVILEWFERVKEILPPHAQTITFRILSDSEREISIENEKSR